MVVSSTTSSIVCLGNGVTTSFSYPFIADSAADIQVSYTDASGNVTILSPTTYTLVINAAATGQLWGIGGSVLYPLSGSPIAAGTFLTIQRILPYTQPISIAGQGDFSPFVIEEMGDTLEMQIQQIAARTTQFRGIWKTNTVYYVGDIVQDATNGNNTKNYYICQIANTSSTWSTNLAAGDWAISVLAIVPAGSNSIVITGDITATGTAGTPFASTLATVNPNIGQFSGITLNAKGLATAAVALTGDITSAGAATTLTIVNSNVGTFGSAVSTPVVTVNAKGLVTGVSTVSGAGGGMVLLSTSNVSSATSVVFSSAIITGAYPKYQVEFDSVYGSLTNVSLAVALSINNGSGYIGSGYSNAGTYQPLNSSTTTGYNNTSAFIDISGGQNALIGNATATSSMGTIKFANPSLGAPVKFIYEGFFFNSANPATLSNGFYAKGIGQNTVTSVVNNIKIYDSNAGATLTGSFTIYGLTS